MNHRKRVEASSKPGKRTVALYETGPDGIERVLVATSAPEVVAAVEQAVAASIAHKVTNDDGAIQ
jgi:hypothetical protein